MTYKNKLSVSFLSLFIILISSCSEPVTPPEEIAQQYYLNLIKGNANEAYLFISPEDKEDSTIDDFKSSVVFNVGGEDNVSLNDFLGEDKLGLGKLLLNLSTVDVVNITTVNNTSVIELSPEVVDYELVFAQIFEKIFSGYLNMDEINNSTDSDMEDNALSMFNELNQSEFPRKKLKNIKVNLQKEDFGWAVSMDLKKLINERDLRILEKELEEENEKKRLELEAEELEKELKKEEERLKLELEELEKELEEKRIAEEIALRDLTITVTVNRDDFTDKVTSISMIFQPSEDESTYRPQSLAVVKYIDSSDTILLLNQDYSVDKTVSVKFRFDENRAFSSRFARTDDVIFNSDKRFFYEFLRKLENTNQLLIGVDGEGSFKTTNYFNLEKKYKEFLCLIDKYDSEGVDETQLKLFPTKYYEYKNTDCSI